MSQSTGGNVYFAYGSNLHLRQMASRCPNSLFVGKGVLQGWTWQINQRGYANVVKSPRETDRVEGLVYIITPRDEERLDLSEGVATGCYEKRMLPVRVALSEFKFSPPDALAVLLAAKANVVPGSQNPPPEGAAHREEVYTALVYASSRFVQDGKIKEEYIGRMKKAVTDAVTLGVSDEFVKTYMAPHL